MTTAFACERCGLLQAGGAVHTIHCTTWFNGAELQLSTHLSYLNPVQDSLTLKRGPDLCTTCLASLVIQEMEDILHPAIRREG